MRIHRGILVVGFLACSGGIPALGQNGEKPVEKLKPRATGVAVPKQEDAKKPPAAAHADDPDVNLIRAGAEEFSKHYNAHDAKAVATLFALNAEVIDEDDNLVKGREAIEKEFAAVFKTHPKSSILIDVDTVRILTPHLAVEEGLARSKDSPESAEDVAAYVAIHVKVDGKWLLASVRDYEIVPDHELTPHDRLNQELSWLVGDWIDESPDSTIRSACKWHDNGNFLIQEFEVNVQGAITMSGTMRIGWNAVNKQFQSWIFDSHGGHATGTWLHDGERWIVKMQGATASGETGSSTHYYRHVDQDTFAWGAFERVIDGEKQDDIEEIVVKRRPPAPGPK
jgi:uncharacterized protein (TIGR02246 family)